MHALALAYQSVHEI